MCGIPIRPLTRPNRWRRPSPNRIIFLPNRPRPSRRGTRSPRRGSWTTPSPASKKPPPFAGPPTTTGSRSARSCRSIQRRPARTSYLVATVFAVVWALAGLLLGWMYLPELKASLGPSGLSAPILAVLAMIFFAPIIFFFVLAHMVVALAGVAAHHPVDGRGRDAARRAGDGRPRIRSSPSARRSAARSPPWATASNARWRAPPNSRPWSPTRSRRSSAPTTTTKCASAACSRTSASQRDTLVGQAEQVRNAITSVHLDLVARHLAGQRPRRRAGQRGVAPDHPRAGRKGRAHHPRARQCRRHHDRGARRARRRPARAPGARPARKPATRSPAPATG